MSAAQASTAAIAPRTILILVALGLVGFLSFLLLSAYADELRPQRGGGTHALSNSAIGVRTSPLPAYPIRAPPPRLAIWRAFLFTL